MEISRVSTFMSRKVERWKNADFHLFQQPDSKRARTLARVKCISPTGRVIDPVTGISMFLSAKDQPAPNALRAARLSLSLGGEGTC